MSNFEFSIFESPSTSIIFNEYNITLKSNNDSIMIEIQDSINIYESNFNIEYLP